FALESRDSVEAGNFSNLVPRVGEQRTEARQLTRGRPESRAVAVQQEFGKLLRRSRFEIPLALSALEQLLDLVKVVDPQPFHRTIVGQGEHSATTLVSQ